MKPKLILVRGLPGSGKSTIARQFEKLGFVHVEADQHFMVSGEYKFDASKLHIAHQQCLLNARVCLEGFQSCVVSNTFTTKRELEPYFKLASEFEIVPVVLLAQNDFGNVHDVPKETLAKMRGRFEYDISSLFVRGW